MSAASTDITAGEPAEIPAARSEPEVTSSSRGSGSRWPTLRPLGSRPSLYWRVFLVNAVLLIAATITLALSPATVSFPVRPHQAYVLAMGLAVVLTANAVLLRVSLAPLRDLARLMRRIDLLVPGVRLQEGGASELRAVISTFNEMLSRLELERRSSSTRVVEDQEEERRRIARELHDEVGQGLTAVLLQLKNLAEDAPPDLQPGLANTQTVVRANLDEVRRIARQLRPTTLDDLGLPYAIHALLDLFEESAPFAISRHITLDLPPLAPPVELALFRIAQETLTNVVRHADASHLDVHLRVHDRSALELVVRDDGRGMVYAPDLEGGGIRGMRERAIAIDATLKIRSRPGDGTTVTFRTPTLVP